MPLPYRTVCKRKSWLTVLFLFLSFATSAQALLSNRAEISIITCGPYQEELYSAFGHSAIRVYDPESGVDLAYNYGVFHFDSKFYLNFIRGHLLYNLGVQPYPQFRDNYIAQNRYVHQQTLDLTLKQKQKVLDYLSRNSRPEFATYRYDYFYNNCATKVRDVFVELFPGRVSFDGSYVTTRYTIRDLTGIYLTRQPWGELGIDICLGLPMDKTLTPFEYMFLPDYVESGFDHAMIDGNPIVKEKISVYTARQQTPSPDLVHPWIAFGGFLVATVLLSLYDWKTGKLTKWFDVFLFSVVGWVGIVLLLLWVATDHHAAAKNFNLLWAFPFHTVAAVLLFKERSHFLLVKYFFLTGIISVATLLFWPFLPQDLNIFLYPLLMALGLRAFIISKLLIRRHMARTEISR